MDRASDTLLPSAPGRQRVGRLAASSPAQAIMRYGVALFLVATALGIALPLRAEIYTTPVFLLAIAVSAWYGGTRPGIVSVVASTAAVHYFFHSPGLEITPASNSFPRLAEFVVIGVAISHLIAARKRAEQSLRQAHDELEVKVAERTAELRHGEKELRGVIETIPAVVWSTLPDGSVDFINQHWQESTGFPQEDALGWNWVEFVHPDDRTRFVSDWRAAVRSGLAMEGEVRTRQADGKYRWWILRNVPLRDGSGKIIKWYGTAIDIEDRKRAEQAREEIEEQWRAAFESNPTMYFIVDSAGTTVSVNAFGAGQLGYGEDELIGQPVLDVFYEPDRPAVQKHAADCFAQPGQMMRWEARKVRKDGTVLWVRETANAVLLKNRPVLLVVCEDITEQKLAEEAARRSDDELRNLIENVPAMMFMALPGPSNAFTSRGWREYTGLSPEDTTGAGWQSAIHPDDLERHMEKWRVCSENGEPFESEARFLRAADRTYRWFLDRAVPLRDETTNVVKWYGVLTDIEDRKHAEALLAGEKRILEMVAKGDPLVQILDSLCRLAEGHAKGVLTSILLVEGKRLRHGGAPSLPKDYTAAIDGAAIGPCAGSCGTAAFRGEQVIVGDIATDSLWADYRATALPHSLRACWSTPVISSQGKVIATFAMYHREPRSPSPEDQAIIEQITHLAGVAIERKLTQDKLQLSETYLAEAQKLAHTGSWARKAFAPPEEIYCSDELLRIYGFDPAEGMPTVEAMIGRIHPEDRDMMLERSQKGRHENADYANDYRIVLPDSTLKYVESTAHPVLDAAGELIEYVGTVVEVTERKRGEALLAGEKRLLEMIATGVPLSEILNELCLIIEEQRTAALPSVMLLDPDGVHLDFTAGPALPEEWTRTIRKLPIGPCAGSSGTAAYRGSSVIVPDIATDPLWDVREYRALALKHGLRACWSSPILSSKETVLGTLCMYYREPRTPSSRDLELIDWAAHLARVAIERDLAEVALRTSEQLARSHVEVMLSSIDVLATEAAPEQHIGEMLRTIGLRLHAVRVVLCLRNDQEDQLRLRLVIENDRQVALDPNHPDFAHPQGSLSDSPFLQQMLVTKSPVVCDDIEHDSRIGPEFRKYLTSRGCLKFLAVPIFVSGEIRGFVGIQHAEQGTYRAEEIELAQALAHHVMLAAHGQEMVEQQRRAAILKERTRMARDIHDTLAQGFTGVIVQMEVAEEALLEEDPDDALQHVRRARDQAREGLAEARRSVHALRPRALEEAAFPDALKAMLENAAAGTSLSTGFQLDGEPRDLAPSVEENLLQIAREASTNVLKHAHATEFEARLSFEPTAVRLELRDNGDGFVVNGTNGGGFGLIGMKERAEHIGATLTITSKPASGTEIVAVSPYQQEPTP